MVNGCIFDLDGTLLNTLTTISYYGNRALALNGYKEIPMEKYKMMVGNGSRLLVSRMMTEVGGKPEDVERVYADYMRMYDSEPLYLTEPYPGIPEVLGNLKKRGIKLAVLSNKPNSATRPIVESFFPGIFDFARGSVDGIPLKPAPDGVFDIMKQLGITPADTLYIGDTAVDMDTGKNAGTRTLGCIWGFRDRSELESHGATVLLTEAKEILTVIDNL